MALLSGYCIRTKRRHFDASRVLSEFGDMDLGVQTLQEVQLNEISSTAPNGYYRRRTITRGVLLKFPISLQTRNAKCNFEEMTEIRMIVPLLTSKSNC